VAHSTLNWFFSSLFLGEGEEREYRYEGKGGIILQREEGEKKSPVFRIEHHLLTQKSLATLQGELQKVSYTSSKKGE